MARINLMKNYLLIIPGGTDLDVRAHHYKISGSDITFYGDEEEKVQVAYAPVFLFVSVKSQ